MNVPSLSAKSAREQNIPLRPCPEQHRCTPASNGAMDGSTAILRTRPLPSMKRCWEQTTPLRLPSLNNMGTLLKSMGQLAEARLYFERALAIREKVLGATHPATATSLNNMGAVLESMGQLAEAWSYYERPSPSAKRMLGADHPDTATSLNNIGEVLQKGQLSGSTAICRTRSCHPRKGVGRIQTCRQPVKTWLLLLPIWKISPKQHD